MTEYLFLGALSLLCMNTQKTKSSTESLAPALIGVSKILEHLIDHLYR